MSTPPQQTQQASSSNNRNDSFGNMMSNNTTPTTTFNNNNNNNNNNTAQIGRIRQGFGFVTTVPDCAISKLSYYLKCVTIGCGIERFFDEAFIDYPRVHFFPIQSQDQIYRIVSNTFNVHYLLNRVIYMVDPNHELLPPGASNVFYKVETTTVGSGTSTNTTSSSSSNFFVMTSSNGTQYTIQASSPGGIQIRRVLLCTEAWLKEFYKTPVCIYQEQLRQRRRQQQQQEQGSPSSIIPSTMIATATVAATAAATAASVANPETFINAGLLLQSVLAHTNSSNNNNNNNRSDNNGDDDNDDSECSDTSPAAASPSNIFFVGQKVKTVGLLDTSLNQQPGIVQCIREHGSQIDVKLLGPVVVLQQQQQQQQAVITTTVRPCNLILSFLPGSVVNLCDMFLPGLNGLIGVVIQIVSPFVPRMIQIRLPEIKNLVILVSEENLQELQHVE